MEPEVETPPIPTAEERLATVEQNVYACHTLIQQLTLRLESILPPLPPTDPTPQPQADPRSADAPPTQPPAQTPTPAVRTESRNSRNTRPAVPQSFDGDRDKGRVFWNSVQLYLTICNKDFASEVDMILWTLSYMNEGRAHVFANRLLRQHTSTGLPFHTWTAFRDRFQEEFFPQTERDDALNLLFSGRYAQGGRSVEDYVDTFNVLMERAGFTDGLAIAMHFRQGLDPSIQSKVATMQNRPAYEDFSGWVKAARIFDQDRRANEAFSATRRRQLPTPTPPAPLMTFPMSRTRPASFVPQRPAFPQHQPPPFPPPRPAAPAFAAAPSRPAVPTPVPQQRHDPMDVDAARRRTAAESTRCYRCGQAGHHMRDCPRTHDIRFAQTEEIDNLVEQLLAQKDVAEAQARAGLEPVEEEAVVPTVTEDFQDGDE